MPKNEAISLESPLNVGGVFLRNRAILAPMSGVTDVPFRQLAYKFGAGAVVSEMVASEAFVSGEAEMQLKVQSGDLPLHIVQLAGREAKWMALAAKVAETNGAQIIDINMGCPSRRVTTGYSGSALMRDLDHAMGLIEAVIDAVNVPVTLKMRLGWDDQTINAPQLASRAQSAGIQMITVHGRTRCQFYKGSADWDKVAHVKQGLDVPLIVNGDITDADKARQALEASGADAVMIGRGAYGAPWMPAQIAGVISNKQAEDLMHNVDVVIEHLQAMLSFYGCDYGLRQARKHLSWYLDNLKLPQSLVQGRRSILTSTDAMEVERGLKELYSANQANQASQVELA